VLLKTIGVVATPLQNDLFVKAKETGFGFTVTITLKVLPTQDPDVGVTVYVKVAGSLVVLLNV
jgi:hypothetical protein